MIRATLDLLRRFRASESGSAVVPFALWTPVFVGVILSGIELSATTMRHTALERALDETVRDVRLGTGTLYNHASLKQSICDRAAVLPGCTENLQLEMVRMKIRDWTAPSETARCVDHSETVAPVVSFEYGRDNELMLLRACYKYKPISPATWMGSALRKDSAGYTAIVSKAAFVQEPS